MPISILKSPMPKYIRISDAVCTFSVSRSTINRAMKSGDLPYFKRGSSVILDAQVVENWVTGQTA